MIGRKMIAGKVGRGGASTRVERRDFLKFSVAASGGLLIGFRFPGINLLASAQQASAGCVYAERFRSNWNR